MNEKKEINDAVWICNVAFYIEMRDNCMYSTVFLNMNVYESTILTDKLEDFVLR